MKHEFQNYVAEKEGSECACLLNDFDERKTRKENKPKQNKTCTHTHTKRTLNGFGNRKRWRDST